MHKYLHCFLLLLLPVIVPAQPADTHRSGLVRDTNGIIVSRAMVRNSRTKQTVVTDFFGWFGMLLKEGDTLVLSGAGYATRQVVVGKTWTPQLFLNPDPGMALPVVSADYLERIQPAINRHQTDTGSDMQRNGQPIDGYWTTGIPVKSIRLLNNRLRITTVDRRQLVISGSYQAAVAWSTVNRLPRLQTAFAQGQPLNGAPAWQGPATNSLFSFGPAMEHLEYDGIPNGYDPNGNLVPKGSGNGKAVNRYQNNPFSVASSFSQSLHLQGNLYRGGGMLPRFLFKTGISRTTRHTIIRENRNTNEQLDFTGGFNHKRLSTTAVFCHRQDQFNYGNRNGLLNRVYQQALFTPISFDNAQGALIGNTQRRYSNQADHPAFLLQAGANRFLHRYQNAALTTEIRLKQWTFKMVQSAERVQQTSSESYRPGTLYFEDGVSLSRSQVDRRYFLQANAAYTIPFNAHRFGSRLSAIAILQDARTTIRYQGIAAAAYRYQRTVKDLAISAVSTYNRAHFHAGTELVNKLYCSNTALEKAFWLPGMTGWISLDNIVENVTIKFTGGYRRFNTELPVQQSFAYMEWLHQEPSQAFRLLPVQEVASYRSLAALEEREWTRNIEIRFKNKLVLQATAFTRNIQNRVVPVWESGLLNLKNLADERRRGIELQLDFHHSRSPHQRVSGTHQLSFSRYRSRVTAVADGYDNTPLIGWQNVYKSVTRGQPYGVIVGSGWLRNQEGQIRIGNDGFPLVNPQPSVIGNPIPDFVIKQSNTISLKRWTLHADWEWRKGGDIWNGTAAVLDYYGRSQTTAAQRGMTGYIFPGVNAAGERNQIPVSFLDVRQPVTQNRWTRYGYSGVTEAYLQKGSCIRLQSVSLSYRQPFEKRRQAITFSAHLNNILLWTAYKGADPNQLMLDLPEATGLDFFNFPAVKTINLSANIQI